MNTTNISATEKLKARPAVFLDRDGTINEQMGYINHIDRFQLLPGVGAAIERLNRRGLPVVVVTNQSGLARGYFPPSLLTEVHQKMEALLARDGAHIDGLYFCPHHPEAKKAEHRIACTCRKPQPGLLQQAALDMELDLARSYVVGDRWSDIRCGAQVGAKSILVLTGYGRGDLLYLGDEQKIHPDFVADDLSKAVEWILRDYETTA